MFIRKYAKTEDRKTVKMNIVIAIKMGDLTMSFPKCFLISGSLSKPPRNIKKARPNKDRKDRTSEFVSTKLKPLLPIIKPTNISKATEGIMPPNNFVEINGIIKLKMTIKAIESIIL